jgi:UDP-N-acetylmuramoyl-tripeptide--D-alanyl-D-alanine ligase
MKLTRSDIDALDLREIRYRDLLTRPLTGVATDSRTVSPGELFVALRGERFDGHRFLRDAVGRGARAVMVDVAGSAEEIPRVPVLVVDDTARGLAMLARYHRDRFRIPVLAVGGSSGKTTTKDMIAAVLARRYRVLATEKNYNNHVGVPRTLFRLTGSHEIAVVEVGTNHPGELELLCAAVAPTHGLLTNIGAEHLEFFGSLDGVAAEEGVLLRALAQRGGTAFVNADDRRVSALARTCAKKVPYGFRARTVWARGSSLRLDGKACASFAFTGGRVRRSVRVQLSVPGRHQGLNALAAAAVGLNFGVAVREIVEALEACGASEKRMAVLDLRGVTVLNDTYNANPDSTIAALETLAAMKVPGKRIAVLADMLELGAAEAAEHRRVGEEAARLGIDYVLTYGPRAKEIHAAVHGPFAAHYDQKNVLAEYLLELAGPGDAVLLKGSRGMAMEDVLAFLVQRRNAVTEN